MNRSERQKYIDITLLAMDKADIPFQSSDENTQVVEATNKQPLMLLAYDTHSGINLKIEFAPSYISFDIELEMCDNFLPARFTYQDDFESKLNHFIALVKKAVDFKANCEEFSKLTNAEKASKSAGRQ